jgi:hypothetical protein
VHKCKQLAIAAGLSATEWRQFDKRRPRLERSDVALIRTTITKTNRRGDVCVVHRTTLQSVA